MRIAGDSQTPWRQLRAALDLDAEGNGFDTHPAPVQFREKEIVLPEQVFSRTNAKDLISSSENAGVAPARVRAVDGVYGCDQARPRRLLVQVEQASLRRVSQPGSPQRLFRSAPDREVGTTRGDHRRSPLLNNDAAVSGVRLSLDADG